MPSSVARGPAAPAVACPPDDQLFAFLPGHEPVEESALSVHVQSCAACQTRLTSLSRQAAAEAMEPLPPAPQVPVVGDQASPSDRTTTLFPLRPRVPRQIGQYVLVRLIGRGGMGLVYQARHARLGRVFAVKLLPGLHLSDPSAVIRLQRETAAAGRLGHSNVVLATDAGEADGIDYLVMEYVDGVDLSKLVAAAGALSVADACEIVRQAALGLAHVAECGLVHRDIKPSNIMLARDGTVKILDLGLARLREGKFDDREATHSGFLLGTADYVSPEQADRPQTADIRSDLYSLGCTLFKLLAGRAPFDDEEHDSFASKLEAHRSAAPPDIGRYRDDVPPPVAAIIARLLAKSPASRFQDPRELADELTHWAEGANLAALVDRVPGDAPSEATPRTRMTGFAHPTTPHRVEAVESVVKAAVEPAAAPPRQHLEPRRRGVGPVAIVAVLVAAAALVAAIALVLPRPDDDLPPTAPPFPGLAAAPEEIPLPGDAGIHNFIVDPDLRMIQAVSNTRQLIKLGDISPSSGVISMELHLVDDRGEVGLFFGYHPEVLGEMRIGEARLIYLDTLPRVTGNEGYRFYHKQGQIRPMNMVPVTVVGTGEDVPPKRDRRFLLEVRYSPQGIESIKLDGQEYPQLLQPRTRQRLVAEDIWGAWGIYNNGSTIHVFKPTLKKGP